MRAASLGCVVAALCASCAPDAIRPFESNPPTAFDQGTGATAAWPRSDWAQGFSSAELNGFILLAGQGNFDLAAADARIRQADARARAAGGGILPKLDATATGTNLHGRSGSQSASETDWSALFSASYEIDFWGRNRAARNSARFAALASHAERATLELTTLAGVANGYFQVLSLRERLDLSRENRGAARELLEVIAARFNAGAASAGELAAQKAAVANAELTLGPLQQQEIEARGALAVLLGRAPEGFVIAATSLDGLNEPEVVPGLPSELLLRRPDILAAESNLQAAHADLVAARAALFPSLTLTGNGGVQNPALQAAVTTLEGTGPALALGATLVQTLFDGGRRRNARDEAAARELEYIANYRSATLNALLDVETALASIGNLEAQRAAQHENVTQSERAFEGARLRYRAGAGDYLTLLDTQRTLFGARDQFSQYRLARLQAIVGLCRALGGGWLNSTVATSESTRR